jgi:hypothetical protein
MFIDHEMLLGMNVRFAPTPDVQWTSVFKPTRTSATMYADAPSGFNARVSKAARR